MKLKEFEQLQELIKKYHELKNYIANVKSHSNDKDDKGNAMVFDLENVLLGLKNEIKALGVEIDNDK